MDRLSVIISTMNREKDLIQCLHSLRAQTHLPYEIVIVDDAASDHEAILRKVPEGVLFQYHRKSPPGLSASRNLGARMARGDLLLFLDDDVVLEPAFVEEILKAFDDDPDHEVGGVSGIIVNRKPKPGLFRLWARLFLMDRGRQGEILPWGFYTRVIEIEGVMDVDWIPGGLSCFRKEVFEEFQLSDLGQGRRHGLADVEFSLRVSRRYRLKTTPFARLYHYPSPRAREKSVDTGYKQALNHCLLFEDYGEKTRKTWLCFLWAMAGLILGNMGAGLVMRTAADRKTRLLLGLGNINGLIAYFKEPRPHQSRR